MNDPRWFKLLLRAIGILLLGLSLPAVGSLVPYLTSQLDSNIYGAPQPSSARMWASVAVYVTGVLGQALLGLYLLTGAPHLMRYCVRQVYSRCPGCDYDLAGVQGGCPECGLGRPQSGVADARAHDNP
jgi:hypothetical protein